MSYNTKDCTGAINTTLSVNSCQDIGFFGGKAKYYYSLNVIANVPGSSSSSGYKDSQQVRNGVGIAIGVIFGIAIIGYGIYYYYYLANQVRGNPTTSTPVKETVMNPL